MRNRRPLGPGKWVIVKVSNDVDLPDPTTLRGKSVDLTFTGVVVSSVHVDDSGDNKRDSTELRASATSAVVTEVP